MTITKRFEWDMGHRVRMHAGHCRNLHGHRYAAEFSVAGMVHADGMVLDFGRIKSRLSTIIDTLDHAMMLCEHDPWLAQIKALDTKLVVVTFEPTAENIALHLLKLAIDLLEFDYPWARVTDVVVYETPTSRAHATRS